MSAIQQGETVAVPRTRGLTLPFDPLRLWLLQIDSLSTKLVN